MASDLEGRVVMVTGAGQGIGAVYAREFAAAGARLVVTDINEPALATVADGLAANGHDVLPVAGDVTSESDTTRWAEAAMERFGRIDGLVNNAALFSALLPKKGFFAVELLEWDRVMAVNVRGPYLCCRAVLPHMQRQRSGTIVNIASSTVHMGTVGFAHYVTSKAALIGLTRVLAREFGPDGIRVNVVTPGLVETEQVIAGYQPEDRQRAIGMRSLPRAEQPADLAGTVRFLLSDDSAFITGQTINVDGGIVFH